MTSIALTLPNRPELFRQFFAGVTMPIEEGTTFYMMGPDELGALAPMLQRVAAAGINIESIEMIAAGNHSGCFIWCDQGGLGALATVLNS